MRRQLDKWQLMLNIRQEYQYDRWGWRMLDFGVVNFMQFPPEGQSYSPRDYKGFIINIRFFFPIDMFRFTKGEFKDGEK